MKFFRKKAKVLEFNTSDPIDVNSVEEEYNFIDSLLSEAGAPLQLLDRRSDSESAKSKNIIDHFTLVCTESGVQHNLSFRVRYID